MFRSHVSSSVPHFFSFTVLASVVATACIASRATIGALAEEPATSGVADRDELRVAYADACLKLAEAELAEAVDLNRRVQHLVSEFDLKRLQTHVDFARQNLSNAEQGVDIGESIAAYLQLRAQLASLDVTTAMDIRRNYPLSISDAQLERLRRYEAVCRARVAIGGNPANALSIIDHLHWETHRLSEELIQLNRRMERLEKKTALR